MRARNAFSTGIHVGLWLLLWAVLNVPLSANAIGRFPAISQQQRTQTVTSILKQAEVGGTNGANVATTQALMNASPGTRYLPGMGGFTMASNYGVAPTAVPGVGIKVATDTTVKVAGKDVGVQVSGTISKADVAGAVAGVAGCLGATPVGCAVGIAAAAIPFTIAYLESGGFKPNPAAGGAIQRVDTAVYPKSDGYVYNVPLTPNGVTLWRNSPFDACMAAQTLYGYQWRQDLSDLNANPVRCYYNGYGNQYAGRQTSSACPSGWYITPSGCVQTLSPTWYPTTTQEIKDKLIADTANNPPPAIVPELEKTGVDWNASWKDPVVVGPAEVTGQEVVTISPGGNSTTTQTRTPLGYSGPTITAGPSVTTQTDRNAGGAVTGTTTTTTTAGTEAPPPSEEKEDKLQCDEDKYPNSLGCSELDTPTGEIPKDSKTITFSEETRFGTGSCPANPMWSRQTFGDSVVGVDWSLICGYAVPIRGMVMALAAFIALLIVMPGGRTEL